MPLAFTFSLFLDKHVVGDGIPGIMNADEKKQ